MAAISFSVGYHHNHSHHLGSNKNSTKLTILPKMFPAIRLRSKTMNAYKQEPVTPQVIERIESVTSKTLENAIQRIEEEKARKAALKQDQDYSPFIIIADIFLSCVSVLGTYYICKSKNIYRNRLMMVIWFISPGAYCLLLGLFVILVFSLAWMFKKRLVAFMYEVRETYKDDDTSHKLEKPLEKKYWGDYFEANVYLGSPGRFEVTKYWKKVDEEETIQE